MPSPEHLWNPQILAWKRFLACGNNNAADVNGVDAFLKSGKVALCVIWQGI